MGVNQWEPRLYQENMATYPNPERPEPKICECGKSIEPYFFEPVEFLGRVVFGSNEWKFTCDLCESCELIRKTKESEERELRLAEKSKKEKEARHSSLLTSLEKMIGARGMAEFHLDKFIPSFEANEVFKACLNFKPESDNLFVWGPAGVGKTHLAAGIMRNFYMSGISSVFIKHAALNRSMQGLKGDEYEKKLSDYLSAVVMVVDDLGTAKRTEFSDQVLYEVLDGRYMAFRNGMIITSNLSLDQLAAALGDDRLVSRIAGMCKVINLKGEDFRIKR